jgi:hypothetical protein
MRFDDEYRYGQDMSSQLTPRDFEILSTYLDGQLTGSERTRLESRLQVETELQTTLEEMRRTRSILRAAPTLRAPRNYTLKPDMVKVHRQVPRFYPVLRLASALASILFVLAFAGDLISRAAPVQAPEEAPVALVQQDAALTTAGVEGAIESAHGLMQSKAPPASADGPPQGSLPAQTGIETTNQPMLAMEMMAASPDATQTGVARTPESEDALREMQRRSQYGRQYKPIRKTRVKPGLPPAQRGRVHCGYLKSSLWCLLSSQAWARSTCATKDGGTSFFTFVIVYSSDKIDFS